MVVVDHLSYFLVPQFANRLLPGGFVGVDVFLVLSGFLITRLLIEEHHRSRSINFIGFYRRRAWRLLPALGVYVCAQISYTLIVFRPGAGQDLLAAIAALFFVGNMSPYMGVAVPFTLAQMWSLGVEEQFYLVWPAVLMLVLPRGRAAVKVMLVALGFASLLITTVLSHQGHSLSLLYSQPEVRAVQLVVGAAIAVAVEAGWTPSRGLQRGAWLAVAFLAWFAMTGRAVAPWLYEGGFGVIAVAAGWVLVAGLYPAPSILRRLLEIGVLRKIGLISYSVYLWHPLIFAVTVREIPQNDTWGRLVCGLGVVTLISVGSYRYVELPGRIRGRVRRQVRLEPAIGPRQPA